MSCTRGAAPGRSTRSASTWPSRSRTRKSSGTSTGCCAASSSSSRSPVRLTRRQALAGAATGALGAAGVYELVDRLAGSPARRTATEVRPLRAEQHVLGGIEIVEDDGVEVVVPPLHHAVVTGR